MPTSLPLSCLTMAPRLDMLESHCNRKPLGEMNLNGYSEQEILASRVPNSPLRKAKLSTEIIEPQRVNHDIKKLLYTLKEQLAAVLKFKSSKDVTSSGGMLIKKLSVNLISFSRIDLIRQFLVPSENIFRCFFFIIILSCT